MNFIGALPHDYLSVKLAVILAAMFQQMKGCFTFSFKLLVSLRKYLLSRSCEFSIVVDVIRKREFLLNILLENILFSVVSSIFYAVV